MFSLVTLNGLSAIVDDWDEAQDFKDLCIGKRCNIGRRDHLLYFKRQWYITKKIYTGCDEGGSHFFI